MKDLARIRKKENFEEKDFGEYIFELAKQAKAMAREGLLRFQYSVLSTNNIEERQSPFCKRKKETNEAEANNYPAKRTKAGAEEEQIRWAPNKTRWRIENLPPCLNSKCKTNHWIKHCPITFEEEWKKLVHKFIENAKTKKEVKARGKLMDFKEPKQLINSTVFSATMVDGAVNCEVLTRQGSEPNLMSSEIWKTLELLVINKVPKEVRTPRVFGAVGGENIGRKQEVRADINLRIKHGTALVLRNVNWMISEKAKDGFIIGKPPHQSLVISNRDVLFATFDKLGTFIDTEHMEMNEMHKARGNIASLLEKGIYHRADASEDGG